MPLLYALPITLAVVGTLAITLVLVEVVVPALIEEHHQRQSARRHRDRRRTSSRRRGTPVLVPVKAEGEEGTRVVTTGVETPNHGYEIRQRRHRPSSGHREQQQQQQHVLGEVTASDYELDEQRHPPASSSFLAPQRTSPNDDALLLFDADPSQAPSTERAGGDPFADGNREVSPFFAEEDQKPPLADKPEDLPDTQASTAAQGVSHSSSSSQEAIPSSSSTSTHQEIAESLASSPVLVSLDLPDHDATRSPSPPAPSHPSAPARQVVSNSAAQIDRDLFGEDNEWRDDRTRPSSPFVTPLLPDLEPCATESASELGASAMATPTPSFVTAQSTATSTPTLAVGSSSASTSTRMSRTVSQVSASFSAPESETSDASWTRVSNAGDDDDDDEIGGDFYEVARL
ncbi:hypothetical protein JCM10908_001313 [Rhodotorula pacifica]|uniref:uncharacterized protein n=1 Tax=Rhodotorula pacifica TaxID=1495444 RepID=UPI00317AF0D4